MLPPVWSWVLLAATLIPIGAGLRFRFFPCTHTSHLQPFSEAYIAACDISIIVAQVLTFGAIWR